MRNELSGSATPTAQSPERVCLVSRPPSRRQRQGKAAERCPHWRPGVGEDFRQRSTTDFTARGVNNLEAHFFLLCRRPEGKRPGMVRRPRHDRDPRLPVTLLPHTWHSLPFSSQGKAQSGCWGSSYYCSIPGGRKDRQKWYLPRFLVEVSLDTFTFISFGGTHRAALGEGRLMAKRTSARHSTNRDTSEIVLTWDRTVPRWVTTNGLFDLTARVGKSLLEDITHFYRKKKCFCLEIKRRKK